MLKMEIEKMLKSECSGMNGARCSECKTLLPLQVCHSNAGYYLGYLCNTCGPESRETGYFSTRLLAERALKNPGFFRRTELLNKRMIQ